MRKRSAKTHLARLAREAVGDEPFTIVRAGTSPVPVSAVEPPPPKNRLGFLSGQFQVPDDFDTMGADDVQAMFEGRREGVPGGEEEDPEDS